MVAGLEQAGHLYVSALLGDIVGEFVGGVGAQKSSKTGCVVECSKGAVCNGSRGWSSRCGTAVVLGVVISKQFRRLTVDRYGLEYRGQSQHDRVSGQVRAEEAIQHSWRYCAS